MKLFFLEFFHLYGFQSNCLTNTCLHLHNEFSKREKSFSYDRSCVSRILVLSFAIFPILGQIVGILSIIVGSKAAKSRFYAEKINGISLLIRGVLTFLGLGIVCLLIDIIITISFYLKKYFINSYLIR